MTAPDQVSGDVPALTGAGGVLCRVWPEQEEGPYHRDVPLFRRHVVEDRMGVPLQLGIQLLQADATSLPGAMVEIWHCDASGRYSGFLLPDLNQVVTAESAPRTEVGAEQTFLRGRQLTDIDGMVEFRTIYPGWYSGRTVHIHVIVQVDGATFTTQLYFPESVTDEVFGTSPYNERPGRDTTNDTDDIFRAGGEAALLTIVPVGSGYRACGCFVVPVPLPIPDVG